jgi:hypothetical protein
MMQMRKFDSSEEESADHNFVIKLRNNTIQIANNVQRPLFSVEKPHGSNSNQERSDQPDSNE